MNFKQRAEKYLEIVEKMLIVLDQKKISADDKNTLRQMMKCLKSDLSTDYDVGHSSARKKMTHKALNYYHSMHEAYNSISRLRWNQPNNRWRFPLANTRFYLKYYLSHEHSQNN